MKVLFVDDEPRVLEALERMFFELEDDWCVETATSGEDALERLSREAFDVVVSDMRMPGMDGADLLREVHARHPEVGRIVLSGQTSDDSARRAVPFAHRFLAKPCNAEMLVEAIREMFASSVIVSDIGIRRALGALRGLPSAPLTYAALVQVTNAPNANVDDVARIVRRDPAMCAKIISIASSAFFFRAGRVTSVGDAIVRLGFRTIKDLVLTVEVFHGACGRSALDVATIQASAERAAALGASMASSRAVAEEVFLASMLRDVGLLALSEADPATLDEALGRVGAGGDPLAVEREHWGVTHAQIGAHVLGTWGVAPSVVAAVQTHHDVDVLDRHSAEVSRLTCAASTIEAGGFLDAYTAARLGVKDFGGA